MKKERVDWLSKCSIEVDDLELIREMVNRLIQSLYIPNEENEFVTDPIRLKQFGIEEEPINWGDLKVIEVEKREFGFYNVAIDEAAPDQCFSFCEYITKYMLIWGWNVHVITEW